ncbi:MAG: methionyl-tRNA formyltransferase [Bacillota bacterium]|nr:methionyl-tRNA formyltransferase [Bacillota bacterium]
MKVIYMGTPDFAVPALQALYDAGHEIQYVVTQPDAVRGRGKKIQYSPVKAKALELGIPVLQPEKIKRNEEFIDQIRDAAPEVIIVAAYGQILPKALLDIPAMGCINIHGSLLPRFRGAAPIQAAIIEGDQQTGITIMKMEEGLDTGDMIAKASTPVDGKTGQQLHDELSVMGAELLIDTLPKLGSIRPEKQDDSLSTYAPMISKQDGHIDFNSSADRIERTIRAFDPWPGTYAFMDDKMLKFWKAETGSCTQCCHQKPGTVLRAENGYIDIACADGILRVTEIQAPGKKRTAVKEYLKGNSIEIGTVLG